MDAQPNIGKLAEAFTISSRALAIASHEVSLFPNLPTLNDGRRLLEAIERLTRSIDTLRTDFNTLRTDVNTLRIDVNTLGTKSGDIRLRLSNKKFMITVSASSALRTAKRLFYRNPHSRWRLLGEAFLQRQSHLSVRHARAWSASSVCGYQEPFRKRLKDEQRRKRLEISSTEGLKTKELAAAESQRQALKWQLTVGLEIHAQLNTDRKLFSGMKDTLLLNNRRLIWGADAKASSEDEPNTNVAVFDLAFPGSQPVFRKATLIPALRAAIALNCRIQRLSKFDRKHYFYQDQPNGYQITQYYEPYALDGHLILTDEDGLKGDPVKIGIKQIQMEQDTAKSTAQGSSTTLLDFNRVGHPLIEIITLPDIHSPHAAAACIRKIQSILQAVNSVTTGMELGGLRADVNVSVAAVGSCELGQRVEIKNLNTFQSVEAAIAAERNRQISILESGGVISGETRGWSLSSTETSRLRGKEGEVDYRYMPDPDIPPLIIGEDLIRHLSSTLPPTINDVVSDLVSLSGLTSKDARTLAILNDGARLDYFDDVRAELARLATARKPDSVAVPETTETSSTVDNPWSKSTPLQNLDRTVANWVLYEIGALLSTDDQKVFSAALVLPRTLAVILQALHTSVIDRTVAKSILARVFNGDGRDIDNIIRSEASRNTMSPSQYEAMAEDIIRAHPDLVDDIKDKGRMGKLQGMIGLMMRAGKGATNPKKAEEVLRLKLGLPAKE
ncbi:MAG: hypothetical protein Q9163_002839 [Psora crenata]